MKRIFLIILLIFIYASPLLSEDCMEDITKCKKLDLTKSQQQQIRKLRNENMKRTESSWRQIKDINYRIDQEFSKSDPSILKLRELNGELANAQEVIGNSNIEYRLGSMASTVLLYFL